MANPWEEQSLESEGNLVKNPFANRNFIEMAQLQDEPGIFSPDDIPERVNLVSQNRTIIINEVSGMTFLKMDDTPSSYAGKSDYFLKVNSAEGGIEFVDLEPWVIKHLYWKRFGSSIYYKQGNVGIGLHNPAFALDVTGDINFTSKVYFLGKLFVQNYDDGDGYYDSLMVGTNVAPSLDTGTACYNTAFGHESGYSLTTGYCNTFLGYSAGFHHSTGNDCVYVGDEAGGGNTTGSGNVLIGASCFPSGTNKITSETVAVGYKIAYTASSQAAEKNVFVGAYAGYDIASASNMVLAGYKSGYLITTGGGHVFLGYQSGDTITTGTNGILIGYDADTNGVDYTNFIGIGYQAAVTASNQVVIGNASISTMQFPWMTSAGYLKNDVSGNITGGNAAAPVDATFVTLSTSADLTNERVLTAGNSITVTDAGAGSTVTLDTIQDIRTTASPLFNELNLGESGEGVALQVEYVSGQTSSRLYHRETASKLFGFSWIYAGNANPTFDGTAFTLATNKYYLIRHETSATGTVVMTIGRTSNDVTFSGSVIAGTATLGSGSLTDSSGAISFGDEDVSTAGELGVLTGDEGIVLQHQFINGNTNSRLYHKEADSKIYGMSWVYAGTANPTFDGTSFTLATNTYALFRHDGTESGTVVLTIPRSSNDVTFSGAVTVNDLSVTTPSSVYSLSHDSFADFSADEHFTMANITTIGSGTGLVYTTTGTVSLKTLGIADTNIAPIDHASVADNDYAKFTASGLEGRSYSEVLGDLSGQAGAAFNWNSQSLTSVGSITGPAGTLNINNSLAQAISLWGSISSGNPYLYIYGYETEIGLKYGRMNVQSDGGFRIDTQDYGQLAFNSTVKLVWSNTGVGIRDDVPMYFGEGVDYAFGYKSSDDTFQIVDGGAIGTNIRLSINNSGHFDFQAGNILTTGTLGCGAITSLASDPSFILESTAVYSTPPSVNIQSRLKYNAAGAVTNFGKIVFAKNNTTDGNTGGYMAFWRKPAGAVAAEAMRLDPDGNFGIGITALGANAATVFGLGTGTAPTTSPADCFQMYSADIVAGNAAPHFRTENGTVIKLDQAIDTAALPSFSGIYPTTDDTFYLGKNDDDTPFAWKGLILKDQAGTGKYYRVEISGDALQIVDLTD